MKHKKLRYSVNRDVKITYIPDFNDKQSEPIEFNIKYKPRLFGKPIEFEINNIVSVLRQTHLHLMRKNYLSKPNTSQILVYMFDDIHNEWIEYYNVDEKMNWEQLESIYFNKNNSTNLEIKPFATIL